jgi:hypothetical protein
MLRASGLVKDCLIVCNGRSKSKAASALDAEVSELSELPDVAPVDLELKTLGPSSDSEVRRGGLHRHWLRLWSVNLVL